MCPKPLPAVTRTTRRLSSIFCNLYFVFWREIKIIVANCRDGHVCTQSTEPYSYCTYHQIVRNIVLGLLVQNNCCKKLKNQYFIYRQMISQSVGWKLILALWQSGIQVWILHYYATSYRLLQCNANSKSFRAAHSREKLIIFCIILLVKSSHDLYKQLMAQYEMLYSNTYNMYNRVSLLISLHS